MPKPRKVALPDASEPLPSLEELDEAWQRSYRECRQNHQHTPAELAQCERDYSRLTSERIQEFRRWVAYFFDTFYPGQTLHTLPEGAYERELDRIADSLRVKAPRGELAAKLTHTFYTVKPATMPMHIKDPGTAAQTKRAFDRAVKEGRPVKVVVENHVTGERRVELQVWETDAPAGGGVAEARKEGRPQKPPYLADVRRLLEARPDLTNPSKSAEVLGIKEGQMKTLRRRLAQLVRESRQQKVQCGTKPPRGFLSATRLLGTKPPAGSFVQPSSLVREEALRMAGLISWPCAIRRFPSRQRPQLPAA